MSLTVISHSDCLGHVNPEGHPERPQRLEAALRGIEQLDDLHWLDAEPVRREQLELGHGKNYLDNLESLDQSGSRLSLDPDTHLGPGSLRAAALAAGAACQGVDQVMQSDGAERTFAVVRPPGHHAESARAMGFCLYSSVAIAALHARQAHGLKRIAVCDFDVHHGNGSEAILADQDGLLFLSSHQSPLYPGTGRPEDPHAANVFNTSLPPESGSNEFREHWLEHLLPRIDEFRPELILVSAGFDAHVRDPLAQLRLKDEDFYWIGHELKQLAMQHAGGRLVASLEGGYDLAALEAGVLAFGEAIA
ncbi:histone deacetylase family protein [Wenzhouxiangella marina]|uniref:Histone deacetylase superfamily protein n=1 Tax=Wenzhouxiangella marina TaxID=1579979 RepID=A0A0K0XU93_9GAMM|nr:histone deacetylase family protein [Wenzhouxiangella marina]AKS41230.1 Histone deacetylase superfamily protein [Wenzhouxiangella marina]MBB6088110.1 acetoin utilization deacetylase AcuC-like enzyme [Wenzhouxiangella marina]